jgi:hypothetical protein
MPTAFTTAHYDAQVALATNVYESNLHPQLAGQVRIAVVTYVTTTGTDEAAADTILLCKLPVGIIPLPANSYVICEDPSSGSFIIDVGTALDADGWADGLDISAAGLHPFLASTQTPSFGLAPTATTTENVYATVDTAAATVTASKKIVFYLAYLMPGGNIPASFQSS